MFHCRPAQLLTGLCDALGACLEPQPLPERAMLGLLLSAVTAGHSAQDMTQSCGDGPQVTFIQAGKPLQSCTLN